jgi:5-hydroxyisourate hydrolase-like protein (transthyretin family)
VGLSGKIIRFQSRLPTGEWTPLGTTTTDANGRYNFTRVEYAPGTYWYEFWFDGDSVYAGSSAGYRVGVGTLNTATITITASNMSPAVNQSFTLNGHLRDANGTPLAGSYLEMYRSTATGANSLYLGPLYTDASGYYTFPWSERAGGSYVYTILFLGDQDHFVSRSSVQLNVGTLQSTALTLTTSNSNPAANQSFTLSGTLKAGSTPLSGKTIFLIRQDRTTGLYTTLDTTTTTAAGTYTFTRSDPQGSYLYQVTFYGDTTYARSDAVLLCTIGTP